MRSLLMLVALAACSSSSRSPASEPARERPPVPDPVVDEACLARAKTGVLNDGLASEAAGFTITPVAHTGAHLHKDGRALTDAESEKLWRVMSKVVFEGGGMSLGSSGRSSIYTCDDVPKLSCFKLKSFVCQLSVVDLGARVSKALEDAGVQDAQISVDVTYMERGPQCKGGPACIPVAHYSTKTAKYDPSKPRKGENWGRGKCADDGDCVGEGSNHCLAWYVAGGAATSEYQMRGEPTFCGCVKSRCSWFSQ